ncbi:hypothetical protein PN36_10400 [Candidatus Thiomargarita nelsonii]|uniref:Acriflavin resistance protein n=1 Tax=Candidatus Thiomargarita nelsonii TaxID=1003181 RepID=A0A4E0R516_9GAMM|nr:hypothetical protein PN36_10400 [Candidatus Thiomargarita nelsonii]
MGLFSLYTLGIDLLPQLIYPEIRVRTWVDKQLSKWFINLPGVAAAQVGGGLVREIQVLPDQQRLVALGLSLEDVIKALKQANVESAGGRLYMPEQEISTRVKGRWQRVEDIAMAPC